MILCFPGTFPTTSPGDCCMFNGDCIPVNTWAPRPDKCEWLHCYSSSTGPALDASTSYGTLGCCMGKDNTMFQDGDELILDSGARVTCCKGRWMELSVENVWIVLMWFWVWWHFAFCSRTFKYNSNIQICISFILYNFYITVLSIFFHFSRDWKGHALSNILVVWT